MISGELWGKDQGWESFYKGRNRSAAWRSRSRRRRAVLAFRLSLGATVLGFGSVSGPRRPCIWREPRRSGSPIPGTPRRIRGGVGRGRHPDRLDYRASAHAAPSSVPGVRPGPYTLRAIGEQLTSASGLRC